MKQNIRWLVYAAFTFSLSACGGDTGAGGGAGGTTVPADMGMAGMAGSGGAGGEAGTTGPTESLCQPGLLRCAGDAIETCSDINRDGIYEWSLPVACAAGYTCSNGICTDPSACEDECSDGATRCGDLGVQQCARDFDSDSCTDWGPAEPCAEGESCSNGTCSAGPCQNECGEGARRCDGNSFLTCGQFDTDECLEWSLPADCGENQTCSNGQCTSPEECSDECTADTSECTDGNLASAQCGQFDADPCLELGMINRCDDGAICTSGECRAAGECVAECVPGQLRCDGVGFRACTDIMGCSVWGELEACDEAMACVNGQCVNGNIDECPGFDATRCEGNAVVSCGQSDGDDALEWSLPTPCVDGQFCSNGECSAECVDECEAGASACRGGGIVTCAADHDGDPCLDWGGFIPCGAGESCNAAPNAAAVCTAIADCVDECAVINETACSPGGVRQCGDYDADDCLDWSDPIACPSERVCEAGGCVVIVDPENNDNATITFFAPQEDSTVSGDLVEIRLEVSDPDGVSSLVITAGNDIIADVSGNEINNNFYSQRWDSGSVPDGRTVIRAVLTDNGGRTAEASRAVFVDNGGPNVVITSPADGRIIGGEFNFAARIVDGTGIQSYSFLVGRRPVAERLDVPAETTELEHSVDVDAAMFDEGPVELSVTAADRRGNSTTTTVNVEFRSGTIIESVNPRAPGGRFPVVARPFDWEVRALAPAGVASVTFLVDGQQVFVDDTAPYQVQIDPALYADAESICPRGQHELVAIVTDGNQIQERASWCAQWDDLSPEIELVQPSEPGGFLALEDGAYILEVAVVDDDPTPTVTLTVDGQVVGESNEPPYAVSMDAAAILQNLATHEQELEVEVSVTDYLGQSEHIMVPVRASRADWALTMPAYRGALVEAKGDNVLLGVWSSIRQQGRLFMLGAAGSGDAIWDLVIRRGYEPREAFFYPDSSAVGVRCETRDNGSTFIHVDPDGRSWEYLGGIVRNAVPGLGSFTYVHIDPSILVGLNANGDAAFVLDYSQEAIPQTIRSIHALDTGDVLVHTIGGDGNLFNVLRRVDNDGDELWAYGAGAAITQNHIDVSGDSIVFGVTDVQGFDQAEVLTRIDFATGNLVWEWAAPLDVNRESSSYRAFDGAYLWRGINLHTAQSHAIALDMVDGEQMYRQPPAATPAGGFSPPGYDLMEMREVGERGNLVFIARRPNALQPGDNSSALYKVSTDGRVTGVFFSAPVEEVNNNLVIEGFSSIDASGNALAVSTDDGRGNNSVLMLNDNLELQWRSQLPGSFQTSQYRMTSETRLDLMATNAQGEDAIFPFRTVDGNGEYPWYVYRQGGIVNGFTGTDGAIYVLLDGENTVDVMRIPR